MAPGNSGAGFEGGSIILSAGMAGLPVYDHARRYILGVAKRRSPSRPTICAPTSTARPVAGAVIGTCARVAGGLIAGDAVIDDHLPDLVVGQRAGIESERRRGRNAKQERPPENALH